MLVDHFCSSLWGNLFLFSPSSPELPWDAPTSMCVEYREWCKKNFLFSPWTKISTEPLCEWRGRSLREWCIYIMC